VRSILPAAGAEAETRVVELTSALWTRTRSAGALLHLPGVSSRNVAYGCWIAAFSRQSSGGSSMRYLAWMTVSDDDAPHACTTMDLPMARTQPGDERVGQPSVDGTTANAGVTTIR
jgi:hypothetical protein